MSNSDYDLLKSKSDISRYKKTVYLGHIHYTRIFELGYGNQEYSNCWFHIKK